MIEILHGDCLAVLPTLEADSFHAVVTDLQAGKAGEYLVCADLILQGHVAYPSEQGLPYDVVCDYAGRLLKIQVKTTRALRAVPQKRPHKTGYFFHIKRCGKNGTGNYSAADVDLFALVALDTREIGYLSAAAVRRTMIFRPSRLRGEFSEEKNIDRNAEMLRLRAQGVSYAAIGEQFGCVLQNVHRICESAKRKKSVGRYLADFTLVNATKEIIER